MSFETISVQVTARVAEITLCRPQRLNAISRQMMAEIRTALDAAERDEQVAAIILHGSGRAFSAGMDLKDDAAAAVTGYDGWRRVLTEDLEFILRFWDSPKVTIAAVHGYCMAAAYDLAIACDITIAEEDTVFGKPELQFGSVITAMLTPHITGPKIAKEILLTADDAISADRACEIGLVNRVVAPGEGVNEARRIAGRVAQMDAVAVGLTKRSINRGLDAMGFREALTQNLELAIEIEATETPSRREFKERARRDGLQSALEWRAARMGG
jgi:enoyl-CoA hydratase